jgi:hypothetical protein
MMKKKGFLTVNILLLLALASLANPVLASGSQSSFARTYTGPSGFEATSIQVTNDGGFIVAGLAGGVGHLKQTWLLRLDSSGLILWQKAYGSMDVTVDGFIAGLGRPIVKDSPDGGFVVAGSTMVSSHVAAWIFKVDDSGSLLWQEAFTGDGAASARSIDAASDGGYVAVAATISTILTFPETRTLVMRFDESGGVIWQQVYNGSGITAAPDSIAHTNDGGFVVVGQTFPADPWMLRLDSTGRVVWERLWEAVVGSKLTSVQETSDMGFVATGYLWSLSLNMVVLKLDQAGNLTWMKTYGVGSLWTSAASVQQTSNGDYVVVGSALSLRPLLASAVVIRLDSSGNILWQKNFDTSSQFSIFGAYTVVQTPNGKFVIAGMIRVYSTLGVLTAQAWILKLNGNGQAGGCSLASDASLVATNTNLKMVAFGGTAIDVTSRPVITVSAPESTSAIASTVCH